MNKVQTAVENRLIMAVGLSFLAILLTTFSLTWIGVIDLRIVNNTQLNPWVESFLHVLMFFINIFFLFSISLNKQNKNIILVMLGYIPIAILTALIGNTEYGMIFSTLFPYAYVITVALLKFKRDFNWMLLRLGVFTIILPIYQKISGFIKLHGFGFNYYNCNSITLFLYSIDLYFVFILSYCVVKRYGILVSRKHLVPSESKSVPENAEQSSDDLKLNELNNRQRFVFWCMTMGYQMFQLAVVLLIGFLNNVFIELLIMLVIFWIGRKIMNTSYHSDSLMWCSIITFTSFYILTKVTLPLSISLFSCAALSFTFVYILHKIGVHLDNYEDLLNDKKSREQFSLNTCTSDQLKERCRLKGFSTEDTELAVKLFVDKIKLKEAAALLHIEEQSARNIKYKLSKRLKSTL